MVWFRMKPSGVKALALIETEQDGKYHENIPAFGGINDRLKQSSYPSSMYLHIRWR